MESQRWEEGVSTWVPRRRVCNTSKLEVALIPDDTTARQFVCTHHYSGSYPAARLRVGLYECGTLVGVAVFSEPANPRCIPSWTGYPREEGVELGRFVLLDRVGFNAESWFWARARRALREAKPEIRAILAYSDPVPRKSLTGEVVLPGHVGTIYQATNGAYLGRSSRKTLHLDAHGHVVSRRALSKILGGEQGEGYARELLEEATGTRQRDGETKREWVARAKKTLRRVRHPGNHTYVWGVTRRDKVPDGKAYPQMIREA